MGSFGLSEGNITMREKPPNPTDYVPNHSREVAQMLMSTRSEWGLNREAWAEYLG